VARTLSSARESAARGDYADALSWLSMLDAIGHELSRADERLREAWRRIITARHGTRRPADVDAKIDANDVGA